jgi:hypothetical protein
MRVLVLFAHPVETSYGAALHKAVVEELRAAGHEVDDCDLYAENFAAAMTRQERLDYQEVGPNRGHVDPMSSGSSPPRRSGGHGLEFRLSAILRVSSTASSCPASRSSWSIAGAAVAVQHHEMRLCLHLWRHALPRWLMGDPPRKMAKRHMRITIKPGAPRLTTPTTT